MISQEAFIDIDEQGGQKAFLSAQKPALCRLFHRVRAMRRYGKSDCLLPH